MGELLNLSSNHLTGLITGHCHLKGLIFKEELVKGA
jgi:hypothetical protein